MNKALYRTIRIIHCVESKTFIVQTRKWWYSWQELQKWSYADKQSMGFSGVVLTEEQARTAAIAYAEKLFNRIVIWEKRNYTYF